MTKLLEAFDVITGQTLGFEAVGDAKGKGTSGRPMRPKVPMRKPGGGLLRSSGEPD